jgi:hypothetical protein
MEAFESIQFEANANVTCGFQIFTIYLIASPCFSLGLEEYLAT